MKPNAFDRWYYSYLLVAAREFDREQKTLLAEKPVTEPPATAHLLKKDAIP